MISCLILAAGLSTRFRFPKALALFKQKPVIEHIQEVLLESSVGEIWVVLGAEANQIEPFLLNHSRLHSVYNKDYNLGQTSSFQAGLKKISEKSVGIMLLPVDCPFVKVSTLNAVMEHFLKNPTKILIPTYQGHRGHPPIFPIRFKNNLLALDPSLGLNSFQHTVQSDIVEFAVDDPAVVYSFNTPEEFRNLVDKLA